MILHSKPTITENEVRTVKKVLFSQRLTQNGFVNKFEDKISKYFNKKYSVCVSSGTAALHIILQSLGVNKKSEVIIPSYTCSALLYSVLYLGAKPVFADVNEYDGNINYSDACTKITKKTKAIIVPHMFGFPIVEIKKFLELGIPIIEDCAQSVGAKIFGVKVGSFSDYGVVSFYGTKMLTSGGEGGCVFLNSRKIYRKLLQFRDYDKKNYTNLSYNYKMTEIQAAIGVSQIKEIENFVSRRKKIAQTYTKELNKIDIELPVIVDMAEPVFYRYIIKLPNKKIIKKVIDKYLDNKISVSRPVYMPLDLLYKKKVYCKTSKELYDKCLSLPIYPSLKDEELDKIIKITKRIFG